MGNNLVLIIPFLMFVPVYGSYYDDYSIGENLSEGDYYKYRICTLEGYNSHISGCFVISMEFTALLRHVNSDVWAVQATLFHGNSTEPFVILVDTTDYSITTDVSYREYANRIEGTIFSLERYEKPLHIGVIWDELDTYFPGTIPLEIKHQTTAELEFGDIPVYVLGYSLVKDSFHYINDSMAFPVKALIHSPSVIFPEPTLLYHYELLDVKKQPGNNLKCFPDLLYCIMEKN